MRGRKSWWKCALVLLLAAALVGSNVDYTMLSVSAQEEDRGGALEEEALSEETGPEDPGTLTAVPLETEDTDPDTADQVMPDGADPEEPGEESPGVEEPDGADLNKPAEEGPDDMAEEKSDQGDSEDGALKEPAQEPQETDPEDRQIKAPGEDGTGTLESGEVAVVPEVDLPDNDVLLEGYLAQLFYGEAGISLYGNAGGKFLQGTAKEIYDGLKNQIPKVANGSQTSAEFTVENINYSGEVTGPALEPFVEEAITCLLMDYPYELYWFDKTGGYLFGVSTDGSGKLKLTIKLAVAEGYKGSGAYQVNAGKVAAARTAAANAQEIVGKYAGKSDYEKLEGYRKEICDLVSYNEPASQPGTAYGDPWQLVWVFDKNPDTNVVCEGYAKAFQYLCDLSGFDGCYTVWGYMNGGGHMWNIVTLDGKNYLVDVTNCDAGTVGAPDKLFLAGGSGSVASGYVCCGVTYTYEPEIKDLFGSDILTLAAEKYSNAETLKVIPPTGVEVVFGDSVSEDAFDGKGGSATNAAGAAVSGTFRWDVGVTSYGEAGTKTLKAVFVPSSADYASASVNVTVKVNRKPIAVTAEAKSKTYGAADPELTYSAPGAVGGYPLSGKLERAAGEDVGSYAISQGTVTNVTNPNYDIAFQGSNLTIDPAACNETVEKRQNVLVGVGDFRQPSYTGVNGETVKGQITYTYGAQNAVGYETLKAHLAGLPEKEEGIITYSFRPDTPNYGAVTGEIAFTVKDIVFLAGDAPATSANAVSVKSGAAYGDSWSDIVTIGNLTAVAGMDRDDDQGNFRLNQTGRPNAGNGQMFEVLYSGTVGGKEYKDVVVCSGTVNVNRRIVTVAAGSYKVSKVYDKTLAAGTPSGELALSNILPGDAVTVTAVPADYTNPNVGGQKTVKASLTLSGTAAGNYSLSNSALDVPCEIRPMAIAPALEPLGSYDYTGSAVTPELTVKNGDELLAASDYEAVWSNNVNAGTAKVQIRPAAGGNYTWSGTVETTFVINKVAYTGEKARSVSVRFGGELALDLTSALPAGYRLGEITVADEEHVFESGPKMAGAVLSGKLVYDKENVGKTAVITVPVTESTNFHAYEFTVTVVVADKMEQMNFGFGSAVLNKVYGDNDFTVSAVNAAEGSKVTYSSSNPDVAQVDEAGNVHILRAGTAVIHAQASETDEYFGAAASCILNVIPRTLAWDVEGLSAADREGAVAGNKATLYGELRVSGILPGDEADVAFSCPASKLTGTYAAVNAGIQKVTLAWADPANPAVLQGSKAGSYMLPGTLPGFTGRINAVNNNLPTPPESGAGIQYALSMETGISRVPQAFLGLENLNTPEKIEAQMRLNIQSQAGDIPQGSIEVYDVVLMVNVNGTGWTQAAKNSFPADGLTVTLPYPGGTGQSTHDFVVCHLFTEDMNGHHAGDVEYPAVEKTAEGIRFKVYGLSPISVGWKEAVQTDDTQNPPAGNPESSGGSQAANGAVASPKTSDDSHVEWYLLSMAVSGVLLCGMLLWNRKRKKG